MIRSVCLLTAVVMAFLPVWADKPGDGMGDFGPAKQRVFGPATHTVRVDCTAGKSINRALQHPARSLIVEINGICDENVEIWRNDVLLRGTDPMRAGIRGVDVEPAPFAALVVRNSQNVQLENLTVHGSPTRGIAALDSSVYLTDVHVTDNAWAGLHLTASSWSEATDVTLARNGGLGARVQRNAALICTDCTFEDNLDWAILTMRGDVQLVGGSVAGPLGVSASIGGQIYIYGTPIQASGWAANVLGGWLGLWDLEVSGSLRSFNNGLLALSGVTQTANPMRNVVADNGNLESYDGAVPTKLIGELRVRSFGRALLRESTGVDGFLECMTAGDAYADDPHYITGTVTGCAHCIK